MKKFDLKKLSLEGVTKHNAIELAGLFTGGAFHGATMDMIVRINPAVGAWMHRTFKGFTESVAPLGLGVITSIIAEKYIKKAQTQDQVVTFAKGIIGASIVSMGRAAYGMTVAKEAPSAATGAFVTGDDMGAFVTGDEMGAIEEMSDFGGNDADFGQIETETDFGDDGDINDNDSKDDTDFGGMI